QRSPSLRCLRPAAGRCGPGPPQLRSSRASIRPPELASRFGRSSWGPSSDRVRGDRVQVAFGGDVEGPVGDDRAAVNRAAHVDLADDLAGRAMLEDPDLALVGSEVDLTVDP